MLCERKTTVFDCKVFKTLQESVFSLKIRENNIKSVNAKCNKLLPSPEKGTSVTLYWGHIALTHLICRYIINSKKLLSTG